MRTKTRPITGPFAAQKQKTGTYATLLRPTCIYQPRSRQGMRTKTRPITGPFAPQKQKTKTYATAYMQPAICVQKP